uniref:PAS domain S-box protein n=1 Tax=Desulfobacca acetoxidans TaxID=60893 RepID=A0A7V6A4G4_9BACT
MARDPQSSTNFLAPPVSPEHVSRAFSLESCRTTPKCFRTIIDLAQEGIVLLDEAVCITFINKWLADMLGSDPEELQGRSFLDFVENGGAEILTAQLEQCRQGRTEAAVLNLHWRDGSSRVVLVSVVPREETGVFQGYLVAVTDITRLKDLESELRRAKEFRDTVFNSITDNLIVIEPKSCRVVLANDSFVRWMGQEHDTVINRRCFEVMHSKEAPCQEEGYFCPVKETARLKRPVLADKAFSSKGKDHIYQIAAYPHFDGKGDVDLVICLERDVTDRRRMEESLAFRSQELQKTQHQMEKLSEIARERSNRRSLPELVQYLHDILSELFPQADPLFLLLDADKNRLLLLEECSDLVTGPLKRLVRRLEKVGLLDELVNYFSHLKEPHLVTYADRGTMAPYFKVISRIYPSWFGLPLFIQQHCLGFFLLGSHLPQGYSREELNFFHALFGQVACYLRYLVRQETSFALSPAPVPEKIQFGDIIGQSKKMHEIYELIDLVSRTDATVLIMGENGTGKELVARTIHHQSKRSRGPFVVANCSAYSPTLLESELFGHEKGAFTGAIRRKKGRFELAQGGTLFLDEIGDIPPATQVLLLRFLQDHCFERVGGEATIESNVRVLAATNKDLYRAVQEGRFRDDLYYRLNVITINLPALRERKEDIPLLCQHFLEKYNLKENKRIARFSADAMQTLMDFDWPGNVRQLENAVSHAVILAQGEDIRRRHLPRFLKEAGDEARPTSLAETERLLILRVLKEVGWNKHEAARRLRVSRSTLYSKIRRYDLGQAK